MAEREREVTPRSSPSPRPGPTATASLFRPEGDLARAARLLEIRPPGEELRRLVQSRMEALARLDALDAPDGDDGDDAASSTDATRLAAPDPDAADRLALHREALDLALARLREARA